MPIVTIRHTTSYRYAEPVEFGDHQLMFRPRDSHDLRALQTALEISPNARVRWLHDLFGNSIAKGTWTGAASDFVGMSVNVEAIPEG